MSDFNDMEEIFRRNRIACDGVVACNIDDWNKIVVYLDNQEQGFWEMYELLRELTKQKNCKKNIIHLLCKADSLLGEIDGNSAH